MAYAKQNIPITKTKQLCTGYVLLRGNAVDSVREQIAHVIPFAV